MPKRLDRLGRSVDDACVLDCVLKTILAKHLGMDSKGGAAVFNMPFVEDEDREGLKGLPFL